MLVRNLSCCLVVVGMLASGQVVRGAELPDDAKKVIAALEQEVAGIHKKTEEEIKVRQKQGEAEIQARLAKSVDALKQLQDTYTKSGKLDEAVAIRERIRTLSVGTFTLTPLPTNLVGYRGQVGKVLFIEMVGAAGGWVYGTDIYTDDSSLQNAVVHAGVLKNGEKGIVKVTILPSQAGFAGSILNGISSYGWGSYDGAFKVERAGAFGASSATPEVKKP